MDENEVAARLLRLHGEAVEAAGAPRWLQVRYDSGRALEAAERPGREGWFGHLLPPGWQAAAVVATGRVHALEPSHELPASLTGARSGGLRLCCVVSRAGGVGWKMEVPNGSAASADAGPAFAEPPSEGMMLDVLRRAVGVPTPEPTVAAGQVFLHLWVEALQCAHAVAAEVDPGRRWKATWLDLIGLHPVVPVDSDTDPEIAESLITAVGLAASWEGFRERAIRGEGGRVLPPPGLAAWMDEGLFSRSVMASLPPVQEAMKAARRLLVPDAYHRLRRLHRSLGGHPAVRSDGH
jgi:hypothetical protein